MFFKRVFFPITGSFGAGFGVAYLLFKNDAKITDIIDFNRPHYAATINTENNVRDLVPYNPKEIKSVDDLAISKSNKTGEIMRHGYPSLDNLRVFDDYVLSYDRRNRVANWVFEHLTGEKSKPAEDTDRGKSEFKEDPYIHPYFRSRNQDYKNSGYDRGHLAAAANHRYNQRVMDQTFFLSNMAPQVGQGFNRDKWNDLEKEVRGLVRKNDNVWVCTGPLYLPKRESDGKSYVKYEVIGQQNVAVPTHFFKVILCEKNNEFSLYSYVLPNMPCSNETPLSYYLVPVDSIERAAGFLLFDKIPKNKLKSINGK